jgi:hypothetical protein
MTASPASSTPTRCAALSALVFAWSLALGACDSQFRFDQDSGVPGGDGAAGAVCTRDLDCPRATPLCDSPAGECVACFHDFDCAALDAGPRCARSHECVQCLSDTDCDHLHACDPTAHTCQTRCDDDHECTTGAPTCAVSRGYCIACTSSADCTEHHPRCDLSTGQCLPCTSDLQCPHSLPRCDSTGACVQCETTSDCTALGLAGACDSVLHVCH